MSSVALGFTSQNLRTDLVEVVENALAPRAFGLGDEFLEQRHQVVCVGLHDLRMNTVYVDEFVIVKVEKVALHVEDEGAAAGHAGAEVDPGLAEYRHCAAGHVLARVIPDAFHHGDRAGVAHRESFAGDAGRVESSPGGTVETRVADDHRILGAEPAPAGRPDDELAAGHALAHVVVGVALQVHVQPARVPDAEALTGGPGEAHDEWVLGHAVVTVAPRDLAGHARADGAVIIADLVAELTAAPGLDGAHGVFHHAFGQLALVEGLVSRLAAELWRVCRHRPRPIPAA